MPLPDESRKRAGQYLRVSLDRSGKSRSVDEQEVDNRRVAAEHGWELVARYSDPNRSASRYATRARENYLTLLKDLEGAAFDVLILWEASRGSRKVSEWVELLEVAEKRRVLIHVTSHGRTYNPANPRDRRSLLEDAVDSEYESGKTSERMKRTTAAAADAGRPFGAVPYGFRREYDPRTGDPVRQVPDETTGPVVREIAHRVLAGDPLHRIAVDLNRRGVPTPQEVRDSRTGREGVKRGGWSNPKLRSLLLSPTIAGWRVHRGEVHGRAGWDPIVSPADHAALVTLLTDPGRRTQRGTEPRHLLSGIATCGVCGAWLRYFSNRGYPSYVCAGDGVHMGHVVRRAAPLEAFVTVRVIQRLADPDLVPGMARRRAAATSDVASAGRELARLQAALAEYEQRAIEGSGPSAAVFERVVTGLLAEIDAVRSRLVSSRVVPLAVLDLAGPDAAQNWVAMGHDPVRRRAAVRALVGVRVHRSSLRQGTPTFDRTTIELTDVQ